MKSLIVLLLFVALSSAYLLQFSQTYFGELEEQRYGPTNFSIITRARAPIQQSFTISDPEYGILGSTQLFDVNDRHSYWFSVFNQVENIYTETGNFTFGFFGPNYLSHRVHWTLASWSRIDSWYGYRSGAGYANITSGEGYFKGAEGRFAYTSVFNTNNGNWQANIVGSFWVPAGPPPPPPTRGPTFPSIHL